eukprot:scaffold12184_cov114-Isochrysis_galbana.AAC.8
MCSSASPKTARTSPKAALGGGPSHSACWAASRSSASSPCGSSSCVTTAEADAARTHSEASECALSSSSRAVQRRCAAESRPSETTKAPQ